MGEGYTKTDYQLRDALLQPFLGRRLTIQGLFERKTQKDKAGLVVLAQELEVDHPTEGWRFLGHMWLQHAETMQELKYGDRFLCSCRVNKYSKRLEDGHIEHYYNLVFPQEVRLVPGTGPPLLGSGANGHTFASTGLALQGAQTAQAALALLAKGKRLEQAVGATRLLEIRDFLRDLGDWNKLEGFLELLKEK